MGEGIDVGAVTEVGQDKPLVVDADLLGRMDDVVIIVDEGRYYALDIWCSHAMASLAEGAVADGCVECPLHGALFDLATGWPLCPPATEPVPTHRVEVRGGRLLLHLNPDPPD